MRVDWSNRARLQLLDAATSLEGARPGAGFRLLDAVDALVARIRKHPRSFARLEGCAGEVRRAIVGRFKFHVFYELVAEQVVMLVVRDARRAPATWSEEG